MARVLERRKTEREGANAFRSLFERFGHIVQEIDGGNDYGEDFYVAFTEHGMRTGDIVFVQVKSGLKYRRASGYGITVGKNGDDWKKSRVPVVGVVYDPEMKQLFWGNISETLRSPGGRKRSVPIGENSVLDSGTLSGMVNELRQYIDTKGDLLVAQPGASIKNRAFKSVAKVRENPIDDHPVGGHPEPIYARAADFFDSHVKWFLRSIYLCGALVILGVFLLMSSTAFDFGKVFWPTGPMTWGLCALGGPFVFYLFSFTLRRKKGGKSIRWIGHALLCVGYYIQSSWMGYLPFHVNREIGSIYAGSVVTVAQYGPILLLTSFIAKELERRRRLRAAYAPPSSIGD
ncbi:DUF4365 domain-containing protein [Streptomyces sp. SL13]|uniref:DUF4365 domain-containing protein n=1 Tax=Streptantibioticus silvisoli TaxID=2705255 RepID=A0AA90GY50_9ACTN|nr:DUF4365 domain-containing protein [Streptantibioticus silvisoli]MDI5969924.1 DUF4365 domain-containing protein [Streptantibioticus silvisoli]